MIDESLGPGGIPLTAEQRAAVDQRNGPLLVAAGAGSGKTLVLVERFVRSVLLDGVETSAILAITFTDKAAAELRDRVRRRFLELGAVERAREAEEASISTIHGFCARLLRGGALRAGLDPRFTVADQEESDRLTRVAFDDALERVLEEGGRRALDELASYPTGALRDMVVAAHGLLRTRGEARPELPPATPRDAAAASAALGAACAELGPQLSAEGREAEAAEVLVACRSWLEEHSEAPAQGAPDAPPDAVQLPGRYTDALRSAAAERYRDGLATLRGAGVDHDLLPLYERLRTLHAAFRDRYAELKSARSVLDFADLELEALALLEGDPAVRAAHRTRYRHVMVDEFQDTNPLQVRLLDALVGDAGSLFTVGDALQAIYRFRHADVRLFEELRTDRERAGLARGLAQNFRSGRELVAAINVAWAEELFSDDAAPLQPRDPGEPAPAEPPVELLITVKGGWDEASLGEPVVRSTAWRLAEARLLADRVHQLIDGGRAPRDVVVLLRATTHMALYERALEEAGVPTYLIGGRGFWSGRQVQDLVAYLALLANPRDDLRLFEVLASPLVGVSADALVLLADASGDAPACVALKESLEAGGDPAVLGDFHTEDRAALLRFAERLRAHRVIAPRLALDALIERIVAETHYDLDVLRMPGSVRRMANVRKLVRLAREFESREGRDLRGLVDRVDELAGEGLAEDREGEAPVEGEALEAVRIMTMHRAKGLQFPVVCLADLGREPFTRGREHLRIGPEGEIGMRIPRAGDNGNGSLKAFAWEAIGHAEAEADAAEERRLHYVAMTRAEELLVLSGAVTEEKWRAGQGREAMRWIADAFAPALASELTEAAPRWKGEVTRGDWSARVRAALSTPSGEVLPEAARRPEPTPAEPAEESDAAIEAGGDPEPVAPPPGLPVDHLSYSALEAYGRCGYRFYLRRVLELPEVPVTDAEGAGLSATTRGSIVHALLEDLDLAMPAPVAAEDVRALAGAEGAQPTEDEVEEVIALVERFARSDVAYRLGRAADLRREEQFTFVVHPPGGQPVLVTGVVDAIGREDDGRVIVDYKTDRLAAEEIAAHVERAYAGQRLIYALAALRDGAAWVEVVHCFLEHPDQPVAVRFEAADAARLAAELEGLAAGIASGEFPVTDRPHRWLCQGCPGRTALCSHPEELTMADPPPG